MPPVDRLQPIRADSSESGYTLIDFMREWPDDATCLEWLWRTRHSPDGENAYCPKCERERRFKKYECAPRRQSWTCMAGERQEPKQKTSKGLEIPVPKRKEVMDALRKVASPAKPKRAW